jgi:quinol-cytochrome oxidoreductase complex cytochrome b subunit
MFQPAKSDRSSTSLFYPLGEIVWGTLHRAVPARISVGHAFGALALFLFALQVATGLLLMIYYRPSAEAAHYSIGILTDEVRFGWLVRSVHAWSSDLLVLAAMLHMVRIYFARAYLAPRRLSWATGLVLLVVAVAFAFSGALLPWDQYAYWSIDAARETIARIPVVSSALLNVFWGGWDIGEEVLLRFYAFHVGILPMVALACLGIHLLTVWNAGLQEDWREPGDPRARTTRPLSDLLLDVFLVVVIAWGVVLSLAVVLPPTLLGPADPLAPLPDVQPRWYFLPTRRLLRSLPPGLAALAVAALFVVVFALPLVDRAETEPAWRKVVHRALGVLAIAAWVYLAARQYYR